MFHLGNKNSNTKLSHLFLSLYQMNKNQLEKPSFKTSSFLQNAQHWNCDKLSHPERRQEPSPCNTKATTPDMEKDHYYNSGSDTNTLIDPIVFTFTQQQSFNFRPSLMLPSVVETRQKALFSNSDYYEPVSPTATIPDYHPLTTPLLGSYHTKNLPVVDKKFEETSKLLYHASYYGRPLSSLPKKRSATNQQGVMFPCSSCNKLFSRSYNLKSHMRTHTQEKPYLCPYTPCVWRFARPHDLKRHELQHTGQKPHGCRFCKRRFARSDALKRHWKVDTNCAQALKEETRLNGGIQIPYARKKRSK